MTRGIGTSGRLCRAIISHTSMMSPMPKGLYKKFAYRQKIQSCNQYDLPVSFVFLLRGFLGLIPGSARVLQENTCLIGFKSSPKIYSNLCLTLFNTFYFFLCCSMIGRTAIDSIHERNGWKSGVLDVAMILRSVPQPGYFIDSPLDGCYGCVSE
jgi:hypothetical protein